MASFSVENRQKRARFKKSSTNSIELIHFRSISCWDCQIFPFLVNLCPFYFDDSVIFLFNISSKSRFCQFLPIFFFLNERIFVSCRNSKVVSRLESSFQLWHSFHPEKCHFTISFNGSFAVPVVLLLDRRLSKASKKSLNHFLPFFHSESTSGRKGCYFLRENCTISGKLFSNSVTMNMTKAKSSKLFIKSILAFLGL